MSKNKVWHLMLGASVVLLLIFALMFLGFLLDIKYSIESVRGINNTVIELSYNHVYSLSGVIIFQFFIILYLLVMAKK